MKVNNAEKVKRGWGGKAVLIAAVAILLGLTVYASYRTSEKQAVNAPEQTPSASSTVAGNKVDYFEAFRQDRDDVRSMEMEYLDEIIATSASDDETLAEAQQQKLALVDNMEKEFTIESLIKAKGFNDAAVTFHTGSVNVVVEGAALTAEQAAQILDIVQRETGESASNIKIVTNENYK